MPEPRSPVTVVGAGLAGSLLAVYLRRQDFDVDVYEWRSDIRVDSKTAGRSINLVLTSRGLYALAEVGLAKRMLAITVPVYGRTIHALDGSLSYQPYGPDDTHRNFSVSRLQLNQLLLTAAEEAGARFHFEHGLDHLDILNSTLYNYCSTKGHPHLRSSRARHVLATDGAGSRCRQALKGLLGDQLEDRGIPLNSSYKELLMPAGVGGKYLMDGRSLHIWPRGSHFLMGLPNLDGSFTMTLYAPAIGSELSFASLDTPDKFLRYFQTYYRDALLLMPDLVSEYMSNPGGFLGTVQCGPWWYEDRLCLLGDAAHAIVPFFGQGCNAAFEGVQLLSRLLRTQAFQPAFQNFFETYKPNADAIAKMAMENYYEMMAKSGDPRFQLQKQLEVRIAKALPTIYCSRYVMVTHCLIPYQLCLQVGKIQEEILIALTPSEVTSPEQVSMDQAKRLVEEKLVPFLRKANISAESYQDPVERIVREAMSTTPNHPSNSPPRPRL
eukprot:gb/GEZN01003802.1/.p1 GENE.gb/GEZN01003802.1/~~gb/GEZN01003802.1/.p1  ORF type:complete len:506 (-),score=85.70 gb/GEZN01003802.1/:576-2060(-)